MEETTKQLLTTIAENQPKIKEVGYNEGFGAGKKSEYDEFWDAYQNNGKVMEWGPYAFTGIWWNDTTFYPKYDIKPNAGDSYGYFYNNGVSNLRDRIDRRGLKLDLSKKPTLTQFFRDCLSTEAPDMDTAGCTKFSEFARGAKYMHTIPRLNLTNATNTNNMFYMAEALQNITFEGEIPMSISFQHSPLTVESLKSIITHLKDYSGTDSEYTYTVTFKTSAFEALEAEGSTSPNGNTWTEYIDDLKWNLAKA